MDAGAAGSTEPSGGTRRGAGRQPVELFEFSEFWVVWVRAVMIPTLSVLVAGLCGWVVASAVAGVLAMISMRGPVDCPPALL
jgi:hypothetical protein